MDVWIYAVAVFVASLTGVWIVRRGRPAPERTRKSVKLSPLQITRNEPSRKRRFYFGVSIQPGPHACKSVDKLRSKRYLTHEAPKLPLPGCTQSSCRCSLQPEDDRRVGFDRRGDSFSAFGDYNPHEYKRRRKTGAERRGKR
jgi:hypothetical protein